MLIGLGSAAMACDATQVHVGPEGRQAILSASVEPEPCVEVRTVLASSSERSGELDKADVRVECNKCTGSTLNLGLADPEAGPGPVTGSSTISVADCVSQLDMVFDDFCTEQNLPNDCAGDCERGLKCKPFGAARNIGVNVQPTGTSTCSSNRFFCACKCR